MISTRKRPFVPVFFLLICGVILARYIQVGKIIAVIFAALTLIWLYLEYRGATFARKLFYVLVLGTGYLVASLSQPQFLVTDQLVTLQGEVLTTKTLTGYQRVVVRVPNLKCKMALHVYSTKQFTPGMNLEFTGSLQEPQAAKNPGEFCYRSYLRSINVAFVMYPEQIELVGQGSRLQRSIYQLQMLIHRNISNYVDQPDLVLSLVLGNRSLLNNQTNDNMEALGVTHLLAISGMHIGLLGEVLRLLFKRLPGTRLLRTLPLLGILLIYVLLSGSSASAWRAWLTLALGMLAARGYRNDGLHLWSIAGTILVLSMPHVVWQIGFQLSFIASGAILLYAPAIVRVTQKFSTSWKGRILKYLFSSLTISLVAQLSLTPFLLYHFGEIALLAPLATLIFTPWIFILLLGGIVIGVGGWIVSPLGKLLTVISVVTTKMCNWLAQYATVLTLPVLPWDWFIVWYGLLIGCGWIARRRHLFWTRQNWIRVGLVFLAALALISLPLPLRRPLEITFLDVGQGDCIYIRTPYNQHILVDGGGDSLYWQLRGRNVGLQTVVPFLEQRGVDELDLVILSHPHEDHLHGLLAVLEHFPVATVVDNGQAHTTDSYLKYLELVTTKNSVYHKMRAGDQIQLPGPITLHILHPDGFLTGTQSDLNNNSLVIKLTYQGRSVLFTGDLDQAGQYDLLNRGLPEVDLVKIPHHGSRVAGMARFYQELNPRYGVITVGRNSYGHPDPKLMTLLDTQGINYWRTDEDGAVTFYIWYGWLGRFFPS